MENLKPKTKIYVGCALKNAPQEYKDFIASFKTKLAQQSDIQILEFIIDPTITPEKIFDNDINDCVKQCDIMIADFSYPSLGLGYEVATLLESKKNIPVIGVAHTDAVVSNLIIGIPYENFSFDRYLDLNELVQIVEQKIDAIRNR